MRRRKLESLARHWWRGTGVEYGWTRIHDMVAARRELVAVVQALVATAPAGELPFVGTSVIEDLFYQQNLLHRSPIATAILRSSRLDNEDLVAVLSGVYPDILAELKIADGLADLLTTKQLDWLLRSDRHVGP